MLKSVLFLSQCPRRDLGIPARNKCLLALAHRRLTLLDPDVCKGFSSARQECLHSHGEKELLHYLSAQLSYKVWPQPLGKSGDCATSPPGSPGSQPGDGLLIIPGTDEGTAKKQEYEMLVPPCRPPAAVEEIPVPWSPRAQGRPEPLLGFVLGTVWLIAQLYTHK